MATTTPVITPLRQRMIDDMLMRKLCDKIQTHYLRAVRQFAKYLGRSLTPPASMAVRSRRPV
jgi:integrase/recombinase XerD